jgi:hypothetical protein
MIPLERLRAYEIYDILGPQGRVTTGSVSFLFREWGVEFTWAGAGAHGAGSVRHYCSYGVSFFEMQYMTPSDVAEVIARQWEAEYEARFGIKPPKPAPRADGAKWPEPLQPAAVPTALGQAHRPARPAEAPTQPPAPTDPSPPASSDRQSVESA